MSQEALLFVLQSLVPFIIPVIVVLVIRFLAWLDANLPEKVRIQTHAISDLVVLAVEQQYPGLSGPQKKAQAVAFLEAILAGFKVKAPAALIDSAIESAVWALNQTKADRQ